MNKTKINAQVVADSLSPQGDRLISLLITFPRIILAEVNTHRMLSKNTSSSRAIPIRKMVKAVLDNPFIPIAFQKEHTGMQGFEYLSPDLPVSIGTFTEIMMEVFKYKEEEIEEEEYDENIANMLIDLLDSPIEGSPKKTLVEWWLYCRDQAVKTAILMSALGVTKQLCNRLLEPFMWTTMLITGSKEGWDNFFELRCPDYVFHNDKDYHFKSKKDVIAFGKSIGDTKIEYPDGIEIEMEDLTELDWLKLNLGQAEIHMMALAEQVYDTMNESTPKQLQAGEYHIPFEDKLKDPLIWKLLPEGIPQPEWAKLYWETKVKISTAMAARTSYTVVGEEKGMDYQKMIDLHDRLIGQNPPHSSPMEHCARVMDDEQYYTSFRGGMNGFTQYDTPKILDTEYGWCRNFKGFIQYRHIIETQNK